MRSIVVATALAGCLSLADAAEPDATPDAAGSLRAAIEDLVETFGQRYLDGQSYLAELDKLQQRARSAGTGESAPIEQELAALRRSALLSNPLLGTAPILFVARPQYVNEHGTEATMYQAGEINTHCFRGGGALKLLDSATGTEWVSRSTITSKETREVEGEEMPVVKLEISSASHPFWTGKMRELDADGKIDRFRKRWGGKK